MSSSSNSDSIAALVAGVGVVHKQIYGGKPAGNSGGIVREEREGERRDDGELAREGGSIMGGRVGG